MDHLACFAAGMYGLAAHEEKDDNSERWMEIAKVTYLKIFNANENIWRYVWPHNSWALLVRVSEDI